MLDGRKKYHVVLTDEERSELQLLVSSGRNAARKITHARILLQSDSSPAGLGLKDKEIHASLGVAISTIERVRQRFVEEGLKTALEPKPTSRKYKRLIDGDVEARLSAIACSKAPEGRDEWTMQLLADELIALQIVPAVSDTTVQRALKKTFLSPG